MLDLLELLLSVERYLFLLLLEFELGAFLAVDLEAVDPGDVLGLQVLGPEVGVDLGRKGSTISRMLGKEQPK